MLQMVSDAELLKPEVGNANLAGLVVTQRDPFVGFDKRVLERQEQEERERREKRERRREKRVSIALLLSVV